MASTIPDVTVALNIISGYEGLAGYDQKTNKYYPYHASGDAPGLLTIGKGHLLSSADVASGKFAAGLTLQQVKALFQADCTKRVTRLGICLREWTPNEFNAALSMFYNNESSWDKGTPGREHRAGNKKACAKGMLLYIYGDKKGKPLLGLWRRRMTEALLYLTGEVIIAKERESEKVLEHKLHLVLDFKRPLV